jgi:hypothetical protein
MKPLIQLKKRNPLFVIAFLLACIGLLPRAQAVSPPPSGGYPNFTTAAGDHALQALTLGVANTALGTFSLFSVTTGASTPLLVLERLTSTPRTTIRPSA